MRMKKIRAQFSKALDFSTSSQIVFLLIIEVVLGSLFALVMLYAFFKVGAEVIDKDITFLDNSITHFVYSFRNPFLTEFMKVITNFGGEIFLGVAVFTTIFFLLKSHKKDALVFSFILVFGVGLNFLLKNVFQRPRPNLLPLIKIDTSYSFPSGHAMNSFIFYACLSYFIFRRMKNKKLGILLILGSGLLVVLIGLSRIYLGVHYPSDVIAGLIAGLAWFVAALLFEKIIILLRLFRKYEVDKKY